MKRSEIKLIIIDLYGMISIGSYKQTSSWIARKYHLDFKKVYDIIYHKYFTAAANRKIPESKMFDLMVGELGLKETGRQLKNIHQSFQKLNKSVLNYCLILQRQGFGIVLLSKNTPGQLQYTVKKLKLEKEFKNIVNTYDVGLAKSSKGMVRWVAANFRVKPSEIVFCDDQKFNLKEAKKMGVKTLLYKNFSQFKRQLRRYIGK